jgi:hypothetical protein
MDRLLIADSISGLLRTEADKAGLSHRFPVRP